jgi:tRNA pseudouridine55 synthase
MITEEGGAAGDPGPAPDGLVIVDKPTDWTSHDVVARIRRLAHTRKVGHAGTLDPMATGVLVVGVGRATRLLGHLALADKSYDATVRLGVTTTTDDAQGEVVEQQPVDVSDEQIAAALAPLTGEILQAPSAVSAIKVDGKRAYARVRAGEQVELAARPVTVHELLVRDRRGDEIDLHVRCSSGTYVRALARDLGAALGVGAHLTRLRRTRVGGYDLGQAATLDQLAQTFQVLALADAVAAGFPRRDVDADEAARLRHGIRLSPTGRPGPVGVFGPDALLLALVEDRDGAARPLVVFAPA